MSAANRRRSSTSIARLPDESLDGLTEEQARRRLVASQHRGHADILRERIRNPLASSGTPSTSSDQQQ
jgi:hypothetical protein